MRPEEWVLLFGLAVILALLGWWMKNWLRRLEEEQRTADRYAAGRTVPPCPPHGSDAALPLDSTPDGPVPVGYKAAWGIDPRFEKKTYPPSAGWLCTLTA